MHGLEPFMKNIVILRLTCMTLKPLLCYEPIGALFIVVEALVKGHSFTFLVYTYSKLSASSS